MEIKVFNKNTLTNTQCEDCIILIKRRFKERWFIERNDVTNVVLQNRVNAIALENNKVVGILGLEKTGELVNGCADEAFNGIFLLAKLAKELVKIHKKTTFLYFALFPNTDLAIPLSSYYATKGYLHLSHKEIKKTYNGTVLSLKRIELFTKNRITKTELLNQLKEK